MSQHFGGKLPVLYENRYCNQNKFDIIINYEGNESKDSTNSIINIERADVKCNSVLIPVSANRCYTKTAVIGSDIFVFNWSVKKVKKNCCVDFRSRSTWKNLNKMPDSRVCFSVSSFINSIYLIGGYLSGGIY